MSEKKISVGILFGGKSAEHEISLLSAKNVIDALDRDKYEPVLIGIDKTGKWVTYPDTDYLEHGENASLVKMKDPVDAVTLVPQQAGRLLSLEKQSPVPVVDVIFPVLHGPFGEDGSLQGLLRMADIPFVGAGVAGSAIGMDKDIMKRLLRDAGIQVARFITLRNGSPVPTFDEVTNTLGKPVFIKPANMGSSVGVSKVKDAGEFQAALELASRFDRKIIIEEYIKGREIECSVLGNDDPIASVPGEIIPSHDFYSYDAKYLDDNGAALEIPAKLSAQVAGRIREIAINAFKVLECAGMARLDFFLTPDDDIYLNEINTIPGFTKISMYPMLWEASGISYKELVDRLIQLAFERFEQAKLIQTDYLPSR